MWYFSSSTVYIISYALKITHEAYTMFRFERIRWYIDGTSYAIFNIIPHNIKNEIFYIKFKKESIKKEFIMFEG